MLGYVNGRDQKHYRELACPGSGPACCLASQFTTATHPARCHKRQHRRSDAPPRATRLGRSRSPLLRGILEFNSGRLVPDEGGLSSAGAAGRNQNQKILQKSLFTACRRIRAGVAIDHRRCDGKSESVSSCGLRIPSSEPPAFSLSHVIRSAVRDDPSHDCEASQTRAGIRHGSRIVLPSHDAFL